MLVGIDAGDFVPGPIPNTYRQVGGRELLAESRRERIEFRSEVVRDDTGEVCSDVGRAEDVELRQHRHLLFEQDFLAIAKRTRSPGKRRVLPRQWEQAHVVGNYAGRAHARPEGFDASGVALVAGRYTLVCRRHQGIIGVVACGDCGLVRHDEDVAEAGELRGYWRRVGVAEQDVLVFFLHQFVAWRNNHFDYVFAGRQHGLAVGTSSADRAVRARKRTGRTVDARYNAGW